MGEQPPTPRNCFQKGGSWVSLIVVWFYFSFKAVGLRFYDPLVPIAAIMLLNFSLLTSKTFMGGEKKF